jgi:hypothetical protein
MSKLSVIVAMGFVNQRNLERPELGDEFDHMAPLAQARSEVELVIVDRAWPSRWDRVKDTMGAMLDRVAYIPPKPSAIVDHGYRAASSMRNSGAIASRGNLLAFIDDFCLLDGGVADEVCRFFAETGKVLCPLFHESVAESIPDDQVQVFSGHSPAVYMCTRQDFVSLNGFDENFDGAYGEEDTEFQNRLDRLLWLRGQNEALRVRRKDLFWRRTWHENGQLPHPRREPWESGRDSGYLRCNPAFFQKVCTPRIERNDTVGNKVPTDEEMQALAEHRCTDTCSLCNGSDRLQQLESYTGMFRVDEQVGLKVQATTETPFVAGCNDPWKDERP